PRPAALLLPASLRPSQPPVSFASSRSFRTVRIRAISRFARRRRAGFSRAPVADWKRRLNSSWRRSASASSSWSSLMSRSSLARKEISLPLHELRLQGQLRARQPQRFLREVLGEGGQLEHDPPRVSYAN